MKIRSGFVSNSSSSSFIALATPEAFEEALSRLKNENDRKVIVSIAKDEECLGKKVKVIKEYSDAGGGSSVWGYDYDEKSEVLEKAGVGIDEDDPDYEDDWVYETTSNYFSVIGDLETEKKWKDQVYTVESGDGG